MQHVGPAALVLAGGAALGAYEVGVVRYLLEAVEPALGKPLNLDILCGTSAGAINATYLAAHADEPTRRGSGLADVWTSLELGRFLRPSALEAFGLLLDGRIDALPAPLRTLRGGLLNPGPLEAVVHASMPLPRIAEHLRAGRLQALTVSATHVASGRCVTFMQAHGPPPRWPHDPLSMAVATAIGAEHVLASAAVPLLFPAVMLDGQAYCDGGLRQVVPLSAAVHLGAASLVVVNPVPVPQPPGEQPRETLTSLTYLTGKALNALFLDRMEVDLARLEQLNGILEAGQRRFGPGFLHELNRELALTGREPIRPIRTLRLQPSRDIGRMAAEYAASVRFARRERGLAGRYLRHLARRDESHVGDLLSYVLFDGEFAGQLIDLGWTDAAARHGELCAFFAVRQPLPQDVAYEDGLKSM